MRSDLNTVWLRKQHILCQMLNTGLVIMGNKQHEKLAAAGCVTRYRLHAQFSMDKGPWGPSYHSVRTLEVALRLAMTTTAAAYK